MFAVLIGLQITQVCASVIAQGMYNQDLCTPLYVDRTPKEVKTAHRHWTRVNGRHAEVFRGQVYEVGNARNSL